MGAIREATTHVYTTEEPCLGPGLLPNETVASHRLSGFMRIWFAVDALVAFAPPLYWAANGRTEAVLGIPVALLYFLSVGLCITLSVVIADIGERRSAETAA